jgi:hypothetical protein
MCDPLPGRKEGRERRKEGGRGVILVRILVVPWRW